MSDTHKNKALEARHALWNLQIEMLRVLKAEFDQENGYESAPTEWFQTLTGAVRYSWIREFTSLMADIDILTELEHLTEIHVATARFEIERLLFDDGSEQSTFFLQYKEVLINSGGQMMPLHSKLKSHVIHLPTTETTPEQALAERKAWQEQHHHQSRRKRNQQ